MPATFWNKLMLSASTPGKTATGPAKVRLFDRKRGLTTVGSKPPATISSAIIVVVVVLPWVPAMAMFDLSRISSASISARRTTGRPWARASSSSGLPGLIAVEITTTSASARFSAACPVKMLAPRPASRSVIYAFDGDASGVWTDAVARAAESLAAELSQGLGRG